MIGSTHALFLNDSYRMRKWLFQHPARADHAAYIASWLEVLKHDKRAIFTAAAHAQRAADFLHGLQQADGMEVAA